MDNAIILIVDESLTMSYHIFEHGALLKGYISQISYEE